MSNDKWNFSEKPCHEQHDLRDAKFIDGEGNAHDPSLFETPPTLTMERKLSDEEYDKFIGSLKKGVVDLGLLLERSENGKSRRIQND